MIGLVRSDLINTRIVFVDTKPHLLIVVLDLSTREETDHLHGPYQRWFDYFCMYVGDRLMNRPRLARRVASHMRGVIILLNKADTIDPQDPTKIIEQAIGKIRSTLQARLRPYLGGKVDNSPILPCSIVSNPKHGTVDDTVNRLREVVRQLMNSTIAR